MLNVAMNPFKVEDRHLVFLLWAVNIFNKALNILDVYCLIFNFDAFGSASFLVWEVGEFIFKSGEYQNLKILAGEKNTVNNRLWLGV